MRWSAILFLLSISVSTLVAQEFTPISGTRYASLTSQPPSVPPQVTPADHQEAMPVEIYPEVEEMAPPLEPSVIICDPPASDDEEISFRTFWKNGLEFETANKAFRFHAGGRTQIDAGWTGAPYEVQFGPGGTGSFDDGVFMRRARLRLDGTMYDTIDWVVEYDFSTLIDNDTSAEVQGISSPAFTDVYATVTHLPWIQNVRIGIMKEPISFEHLTSSRWTNFMERSYGFDAFSERGTNGFTPGIMMFQHFAEERIGTWLGLFRDTNQPFGFSFGDQELAVTGRIAGLPVYQEEGKRLVHVAVAASHRVLNDGRVRLRARPSVRSEPGLSEPPLANTGFIGASDQEIMQVEFASVLGPWSFVSEYFMSTVSDAIFPFNPMNPMPPLGNAFYSGGYVEALYFLTGEHRAYNRSSMVFDRVTPLRNFSLKSCSNRGWGAWQVGARYGYIDLQDLGINGATLHEAVLGINWILNPNTRIYFNYACDYREPTPAGSAGAVNLFGMRFAFDF